MGIARRGGIAFLSVNGVQKDVKGVATYRIGGKMRDDVVGQDAVHGFSEKPSPCVLSLLLSDSLLFDLKVENQVQDATIVLQLANGKSVSFRNAWGHGDWEGESSEGEIKAEYHALSANEQT
jgi:hypothetical protein